DPIAETLKKEEAKKKAEDKAKAKAVQQAQVKPPPQFDALKIAALLDKREPMRQASAAETLNPEAESLGKATGYDLQLSDNEKGAYRHGCRRGARVQIPIRQRGPQHRRHARQHPADPDRNSGFRRR